jgi:hypothetical protein
VKAVQLWAFLAVVVAVGAIVTYAVWPSSSKSSESSAPRSTVTTHNASSQDALNHRGNSAASGPYLIPNATLVNPEISLRGDR